MKHSINQSFKSIFTILLALFVGGNVVWAQGIAGLIGGIDPENPATWFYVNLTAQPSTPACGTNPGQVWLRSVAPTGDEDNPYSDSNPYVLPAKPANPYEEYGTDDWRYRQWSEEYGFTEGMNDAKNGLEKSYRDYWEEWTDNYAVKAGYDAGWDWYNSGHYLNPENPVGFAATVSLKGYTVVYAPGFEDMNVFGNVFSAYASFYGKTQENDGWYFAGWSYTEGDTDLGVGDENGVLFRVLPAATAGETNIRNENVYATFQPVRVSDYKVNGLINKSVSNTTTIVFDAVGERVSTSDFTVSVPEANFTAAITSCEANKVTVTVTYSGSANGEFRGNVTLASKSGCSQLTAPVYARVCDNATNEATLYDGKTPTATSGTLEAMIAAANGTDKIVVLNKNYESNLSVNANVTLNFNGYTVQDLTVAGGEVTIAYDKYGSNGEAVFVTGGKLILNGGEFSSLQISNGATVEQNGATITGAATNNGTLVAAEGRSEGGLTSAGTLTVNGGAFEGTTAVTVSGGTAIFNKAAISGTTTGILVSGGETTISSKLVSVYGGTNAIKQQTSGSIVLQNGKFDGATPLAGTINLQGGYFKTNTPGIAIPSGKKVLNVLAGTEFAEGYRYFIGDDATGVGVCRIGTTSYATLEAALAYANNNPSQDVVIIMTNDYTLPAGYYTLPARATLIVPMSDEQETGYEIVNRVSNNSAARLEYLQPYEFRRLTFAYGVNMDVHGTIELTCTQRASDDGYAAMPHGPYGHLVMEEGSHMTLQSGSLLRAWGFMTGKGETDARRGSKVREQFQMGDWKGGGESFKMLDVSTNQGRVFPISQYFIQNIESPVKYHPGAILSTTTSVSAAQSGLAVTAMANDIIIVGVSGGDPAMFFMDQEADAENTWVRKWYDAEHDVQTYDVNTGAHIGSMVLDLGKLGTAPLKMNSGMFVLPITNNMKIHLLSGSMDFTQVTSLLPGAEVEVDKESTVTIYSNPDPEVFSGALIIYDKDQWGEYANGKCIECVWNDEEQKYEDGMETGYYTKVVKYSPSWDGALVAGKPANGKPTVRHEDACPDDASINVHGTFATGDGCLLTTAGGANIFSSNEDAGTFICSQNPPSDETLAGLYVLPINNNSVAKKLYLAKLKNGKNHDPQYTETAGAIQGLAFIYRDGAWQMPMIQTANDMIVTYNSNCFTADVSMMTYLAQVCNVTDYSSQQAMLASPMKADVKNTVAIVHAPDNIAEFLAAKPLAAQMAPGEEMTAQGYEWMKHSDAIYQGNVTYKQAFAMYKNQIQGSANAIKEAGYDFGATVQKVYIKPQEWLEIAGTAHLQLGIDDVSYYEDLYNEGISEGLSNDNYSKCTQAVNEYLDYIESQRMNPAIVSVDGNADHTYSDADGAGRLFILMDEGCQWWEVEKKDNLYHCIHPQNDTYYHWVADAPDPYDPDYIIPGHWEEQRFTITWKNWDGTIIKTGNADGDDDDEYSVTYGTMAEFLGTNPTRKPDIDYTYDFTGWSPELAPVTSDVTYTATYEKKERKYTITFLQEGGVEIERQFLPHNAVPVCENMPTKVGHTLVWNPAISPVITDQEYTATWLEELPDKWKVSFVNNAGYLLQEGDVLTTDHPVYSGTTPKKENADHSEYSSNEYICTFNGWSAVIDGVTQTFAPGAELPCPTAPTTYTAVYTQENKTYTITFNNEDGELIESHEYKYGETPVCYDIPTKNNTAQYSYSFAWTPQIETVRETKTYTATFTPVENMYTVTLLSNPSEACTFTGAGIYKYNADVAISQTPKDGYKFQKWTNATGDDVSELPTKVTEDINLVANFLFEGTGHEITWKNWNGNELVKQTYKEGTATTYTGQMPTRPDKDGLTYTFDGWSTTQGGELAYKNNMTPKATAPATYFAHFAATEIPDLNVTGITTLKEPVTKRNLVITSNGNSSGQLLNPNYLTITGNAYFDLTLNANAETWYAFGLPWQVNTNGGISADGRTLVLQNNCYLLEFDGELAANGALDPETQSTWRYVKSGILQPGKLYMIYLRYPASTIRFKAAGADLVNNTITLEANSSDDPTADAKAAGWNAIANPTTCYAKLVSSDIPSGKGQVYVPGRPKDGTAGDRYDPITLADQQLIVGQPLFVQISPSGAGTIVANNSNVFAAPRRAPQTSTEYEVRIAPHNGAYTDRLYISTSDEKEDKYIIGQDLAKISVATGVAQMWVNCYDAKLCANVTEMMNNQATFPLGIYAPKTGQYTLSTVSTTADDEELYVTIDGTPVWDLATGAYTIDLQQGNTNEYGLLIIRRPAPEVTTGCQNVEASENASVRKVLINGQVFILRDGAVYTIFGQKAK